MDRCHPLRPHRFYLRIHFDGDLDQLLRSQRLIGPYRMARETDNGCRYRDQKRQRRSFHAPSASAFSAGVAAGASPCASAASALSELLNPYATAKESRDLGINLLVMFRWSEFLARAVKFF